jgi:hypothetical protein
MTRLARISGNKGLVRDMESKAILNIDIQAKLEHKRSKEFLTKLMTESNKIEELENDINEIKNDINEIKNMFLQLTKNKV